MGAYNVILCAPPGYVHALALWDVGLLLYHSFGSLGLPCALQVNTFDVGATNVLLGYHLLGGPGALGPHPFIVYQLEQLSDHEGWLDATRLDVLRGAREVWDYSPENVAFLRERGVAQVKLLPLGFHENLRTVRRAPEQDIDVLFYGSLNDRRRAVLDELHRHCRVQFLCGVYGEQRDAFVGRAKVVLNMHFYAGQILEQARISYLLNNRCFVVSEDSPHNPYAGGFVTAPYAGLAACCLRYLQAPQERERLAEEGFLWFSQRPMVNYLKAVLEG